MHTYKFPIDSFYGVMVHIANYNGMLVESITHDEVEYTVIVNIPIIEEQVEHLNQGYGLTEVIA